MNIEKLIERCIENDRVAQRQLYLNYKDNLYTVAYRITGDFDSASDLLQECFMDAYKGLHKLKERKFFYSWIKKIMIRKAYNHVKKQVRTEEIKEYDQMPNTYQDSLDTEYIEQAIQSLPLKSRTVFIMCEVEGFSHKEIAETMDISVGTSKSQLNYAKTKLKVILSKYLVE